MEFITNFVYPLIIAALIPILSYIVYLMRCILNDNMKFKRALWGETDMGEFHQGIIVILTNTAKMSEDNRKALVYILKRLLSEKVLVCDPESQHVLHCLEET